MASLAVGFAAFRVSRHSFAITSLVFALVLQQIAFDWTSVTRGAMGIPGLPPLELSLPGLGPAVFDADHPFYYLILGWALATVGATRALIDCLTRYQTADAGSWSLAARELSAASRYRIAHAGVTRTFQAVCPCAASPSIASRRRRAWPTACPSCPRGAATSRT